MDIRSKIALVTGAGTGIGQAIATTLGQSGMHVVCASRRLVPLEETVKQIEYSGGRGLALSCDVTDWLAVQLMVQQVRQRLGQVDVLINNAASFQCLAPVHEADCALWWHDVTVNLRGPMHCIRAVLPAMIQRDQGVIINLNGGRPMAGSSYGASKAGLMQLTETLAAELAHLESNVMVFSAGPGLVRTDMTEYQVQTEIGRKWIPGTKDAFEQGRTRDRGEIAQAIVTALRQADVSHRGKHIGPDFRSFE